MKEQLEFSEEYALIAKKVIETNKDLSWLQNAEVSIGYMSSNKKKKRNGKATFADCRKIPDRDKKFIPFDFLITVYDQNIEGMTDEQMEILIYHELLHVGVEEKDDGSMKYFIVPHDIEDFTAVLDRYGENWADIEEDSYGGEDTGAPGTRSEDAVWD